MSQACRLYLITPPRIDDLEHFSDLLGAALDAGDVGAVQLRLKDADDQAITRAVTTLRPIATARNVAFILNDRPDLSASLECDGVHIGQTDWPYAEARRSVGPDRIIGVTCHDSRHLAMEAAEAGADYVAFGAFFPSGTKVAPTRAEPEILTLWQELMLIPCVAIGGIVVDNCRSLVSAGADFLAVSAGVWAHPDGPVVAIGGFLAEIASGLEERS